MEIIYTWPSIKHVPPLPEITLEDKQRDGVAAGYPKHLCHLLEYEMILALPDIEASKSYLEWYTKSREQVPIGIMLVDCHTFENTWGMGKAALVDDLLTRFGRPPGHWYLVWLIRGYDKATGIFRARASTALSSGRSANTMTYDNLIGKPVFRVM